MTRKDIIRSHLLTLQPFAGDASDPRIKYNRRWMLMYYLSGLGMKLYNMYRHWLVIDDYKALFEYAVLRDGFTAKRDAGLPIYYGTEFIEGATHTTGLLVEDKVMIMLYRQPTIGDDERHRMESHMMLTHTQFGFIGNFGNDQFYSEWYVMDSESGTIERGKLM